MSRPPAPGTPERREYDLAHAAGAAAHDPRDPDGSARFAIGYAAHVINSPRSDDGVLAALCGLIDGFTSARASEALAARLASTPADAPVRAEFGAAP